MTVLNDLFISFSLVEQKYECAECFIKLHPESGHRFAMQNSLPSEVPK